MKILVELELSGLFAGMDVCAKEYRLQEYLVQLRGIESARVIEPVKYLQYLKTVQDRLAGFIQIVEGEQADGVD